MKFYNTIEQSALFYGDNLEVMDDLPAYSIDLIVTDPPYNFTKANCTKMYKETSKKLMSKSGLNMTPRLMKKMNAYIFCSEVQVPIYAEWAEENACKFSILVWEKPLTIISKSRFSQNAEFIVRIYDDGTALNKLDDCDSYNRVLHYPVVTKKLTPTQKPVELIARLIRLSSPEGGVVLDPFLGSGTTAVAAQRLGRKYIGIEKNQRFYRIAENRLKEECVQMELF